MFKLKILIASLLVFVSSFKLADSAEEFPYQAVVQSKLVEVRSGPGQTYYVTSNLKNGDKVTVHRHDPGGWFQISPPAGSFSWIRADQVTRQGNTGIVINNDTIVRVGSSVEDHYEVEQRRLLAGDEVSILGEKSINKNGKIISLLKISPPPLEYRWVKGDYIVPLNRTQQVAKANDPYAVPVEFQTVSNTKTEYFDNPQTVAAEMPSMEVLPSIPGDTRTSGDEPLNTKPSASASTKSTSTKSKNPEMEQIEAKFSPQMDVQEKTLNQLDNTFSAMIKQDPSTWNLEELSQGYQALQKQALTPVMSHQVDLRLAAVDRYRKTKAQHDEVQGILTQTLTKDAQFSQEAMNIPVENPATLPAPPVAPVPSPMVIPANASTVSGAPQLTPGTVINPQSNLQQPYIQPASATNLAPPAMPPRQLPFSGAGVVQRSVYWGKQGPSHVLVSTQQGKILAYLQAAPGVNLDGFLGRSVGVTGPRAHIPNLQSDLITVQQVSPVRLAQ